MKKHVMFLTYEPKIEPVRDGRCTQIILSGLWFDVGNEILIRGWEGGKPRYSEWYWKKLIVIQKVFNMSMDSEGITFIEDNGENMFFQWDSSVVDLIAKQDFINPPTGIELKTVLERLGGFNFSNEPREFQIIKW